MIVYLIVGYPRSVHIKRLTMFMAIMNGRNHSLKMQRATFDVLDYLGLVAQMYRECTICLCV